MKKRWAFALACLIALAAVLVLRPSAREPVYDGKPVSYWIEHLSRPVSLTPVSQLTKELPSLELNASLTFSPSRPSPFIEENLFASSRLEPTEHPSFLAIRAMGPTAVPGLIKSLDSRNPQISQNAARLLGRADPNDETVYRALVKRMRATESTTHRIYRMTWGALPGAISTHLQKPDAPQPFARRITDRWYTSAHPSYIALGELLYHYRALQSSNQTAQPLERIVPELCIGLSQKQDWVALLSAQVLFGIGAKASNSIPYLIRELQNKGRDVEVRVVVAQALAKVGAGSTETVAGFKTTACGTNRVLQCAAIVGLGTRGQGAEDAIGLLDKFWHGPDRLLSCLAYESLQAISPEKMKNSAPPEPIQRPGFESAGYSADSQVMHVRYDYMDLFIPTDDASLYLRFRR